MTIKHISLLGLLLFTIVLGSCKKDDDPQSVEQVITPGVGITDLKIGDTGQKAIDLYGTVDPSYGSSGGQYTHFLTYFTKGVLVYFEQTTEATFNAQMKIASLSFSAPFSGKTDKQIGIGSTKTAVKAAYGEPIYSSMFFGDAYVGITFIYDGDTGEKVETIEVE